MSGLDHHFRIFWASCFPRRARKNMRGIATRYRTDHTDLEEKFARHTGYMNFIVGILTILVAMIGILAGLISYIITSSYREQIEAKEKIFSAYEVKMKELLEKSQLHEGKIQKIATRYGISEKFSLDLVQQAHTAVASGKGIEVLWGEAILAQENEAWEKAYTFWKAILNESPKNGNALFGAALSCANLAERKDKNRDERLRLLDEGMTYLERIPPKERNADVYSSWGVLLAERAKETREAGEKAALQGQAEEQYRRATEADPKLASAWSNWGSLLAERATETREAGEKAALQQQAEEQYRRATDSDPKLASAWSDWGALLIDRARDTGTDAEKRELLQRGKEFLKKALDLHYPGALYPMACLAAQQGHTETALRYLRESARAGSLPPLEELERNPDLEPMRGLVEYKKFIQNFYHGLGDKPPATKTQSEGISERH